MSTAERIQAFLRGVVELAGGFVDDKLDGPDRSRQLLEFFAHVAALGLANVFVFVEAADQPRVLAAIMTQASVRAKSMRAESAAVESPKVLH